MLGARWLLAAGFCVASALPAMADECQTPELLRGKPAALTMLMPPVQSPKGEFETSEEYAARALVGAPVSPLLVLLEDGSGVFTYNADDRRFTWKRDHDDSESPLGYRPISVGNDLYKVIKGDGERAYMNDVYLRKGLLIEDKTLETNATRTESRAGIVLYPVEKNVPVSISTVEVSRDKAEGVKKGLRAVALIEPEPPYFVRGTGGFSGVSVLTGRPFSISYEYQAVVANVLCVGVLDRAGAVLGSVDTRG